MSILQPSGFTPPIPDAYGTPYLVCLVKNVHWVYVFWELTDDLLNKARQDLGEDPSARIVLRVWMGEAFERQVVCDLPLEANLGAQYVHLPQPGSAYQMEILLVGSQGSVSLLASNFAVTPFGGVCAVEDENWASIEDLYTQYAFKAAGEQLSSPQLWHISSQMYKPPQPADELELIVDTELVIYGKTAPDAVVFIQGEAVPTNPDGSFTVRYALPEGCTIFPIKAVSRDGKQKQTIVPLITKETY